jgi:hypothetical protein
MPAPTGVELVGVARIVVKLSFLSGSPEALRRDGSALRHCAQLLE